MSPPDDPVLKRLTPVTRALAGPMPGGRCGLAPTLGPDLAAVAAGDDVELAVAVLRPAATPPTLVDAIAGRRLLSLTGDIGSDAGPVAVAVVGSPGCAMPGLTLQAHQRRALERLDGLGGRGGRTVAPTYRGSSEVASVVQWAREVMVSGARWPHSAAVLQSEPLRVTVPAFLPDSANAVRIALLDVPAPGRQGERAHATIIVLDYRDLVGSAQQAAQLSRAARDCYAAVGADRFVVVVDGVEHSHSDNPGNLRHTIWRRARAALQIDLAPASVLSVSSVLALSSTATPTASARDIRRGVDGYERSQVGAVQQALRTLRDRAGEVVAATAIRRLRVERDLPAVPRSPAAGEFADEDVASSWAQLYATACLPLITSTLDRFDADVAER